MTTNANENAHSTEDDSVEGKGSVAISMQRAIFEYEEDSDDEPPQTENEWAKYDNDVREANILLYERQKEMHAMYMDEHPYLLKFRNDVDSDGKGDL